MQRAHAKTELAERELALRTDQQKLAILAEYWQYDCVEDVREAISAGDMPMVSDDIAACIVSSEAPMVPLPPGIEVLLLDYLVFDLHKARNGYIADRLKEHGLECDVEGEVEEAGQCPCCGYYSIDPGEEGLGDICPVCFWENGGDGPNHMPLSVAQANFREVGAIDRAALEHVAPDGKRKYAAGGHERR